MRRSLAALLGCLALAALGCGGGGSGHAAGAAHSARQVALPFAPYADVSLAAPNDVAAVGLHAPRGTGVTLAFITAAGGSCSPAWGSLALRHEAVDAAIARLRGQGRRIRVSFGGRDGVELARACPDAPRLAAAYARVLDAYELTAVDFDLEGATLGDQRSVERRSAALALLERRAQLRGQALVVSMTLPVLPTGLEPDALRVLRSAVRHHVRMDIVNLLAMDYGAGAAPRPDGQMGRLAIQALNSAHDQLARVLPGGAAWSALGVTPMLGRNDVRGETLTLPEARQIGAFARRTRLGLVSMWSLARDRPCPHGAASAVAQPACSGIAAPPYAFSHALGGG